MGVHICFYKKLNDGFVDADNEVFGAINEEETRERGDTEFAYDMNFDVEWVNADIIDAEVYRPTDFKQAKECLESNEFTNRDRFFKFIDYLERNKDVYIWISS